MCLAITATERSIAAAGPENNRAELGLPGVQTAVWYGAMVSARAPAAVVQKLKDTTLAIQNDPVYIAGLAQYGIKISAVGPDGFAKFLHDEAERWRPIVQSISSN